MLNDCVFKRDEGQEGCSEWVQRHHCLPPVSPHEGRRQAVLDSLFDDVWQEAVGWMKDLLQSYWEYCSCEAFRSLFFLTLAHLLFNCVSFDVFLMNVFWPDDETISGSVSLAQPDSQDALLLMSALSTTLPKLGQSRMPPFTAGPQYQVSGLGRT